MSIVGKPNVGKSTLMNKLVGEKLSIITSKAQTTRHRILGILSGEDFQVVYSDTPGVLEPQYKLQSSMMRFVNASMEDADIILFVTDPFDEPDEKMLSRLAKSEAKHFLIFNKTDLDQGGKADELIKTWQSAFQFHSVFQTSALNGDGVTEVFDHILKELPEHPPYFPKDELTDKPEKFFASEIIREKIFNHYKKEVPYSTEVVIDEFHEDEDIIHMRAEIYVERKSQKGILIGKGGEALKKIGTEARLDMEAFFGKKVFLETFVKVAPDWRKKGNSLRRFGY